MSTAPIIKRATTNLVFNLAAPTNARVTQAYLCTMTLPGRFEPVKFNLTKGWLKPGADMINLIKDISSKPTEISVNLTGFLPSSEWDTVMYFGIADIPQLPGKVNVPIADADDPDKKGFDDIGISSETTPVILLWNQRLQSGAILRYDNAEHSVLAKLNPVAFGDFEFPLSDPLDIDIPWPFAPKIGEEIDEDDIY